MAVPSDTNSQGTVVSSAILQNNIFVSSIQAVPANCTVFSSGSTSLDVKPQLQQVRLVQAISGNNASTLMGQHQIVRIIKQSNDGVPNGNILNLKASFAKPVRGETATLLNLPVTASAKVFHQGTKLRVGDTITIPKSRLMNDKATPDLPPTPPAIPSTPTKVIRVDATPNQNSGYGNQVVPSNNTFSPAQMTAAAARSNAPFPQQGSSPDRCATYSPSWNGSPLPHKRPSVFSDATQGPEIKRRRTPTTEKGSKGLRHFAMLVCEKVKQKVTTTYNEVADELVAEYSNARCHLAEQQLYDQKNIRRRVYDALNVLMAMDIIYKDKKDIHWVGLPTNSAQEVQTLQAEKNKREQRVQQKTLQLQELILQQIAFKNLVQRNKREEQIQGPPAENSTIQLPFIIVNTGKKTIIDCSISNDKHEYMFNFDDTFEIHDDIEVLKRMGLAYGLEAGRCSKEKLKSAQTLVPPVLKPYLEQMAGHPGRADETRLGVNPFLEDGLRIVSNGSNSESSSYNLNNNNSLKRREPTTPGLNSSSSSISQFLDAEDQEVAMVTRGSSDRMAGRLTSSSRSSSSGLHGMFSLTPMSSAAESESRDSTPDFRVT